MKQHLSNRYQALKNIMEARPWLQIVLLAGTWGICQTVVNATHFPIPGGVMGLLVVVTALLNGWISPVLIVGGAKSLIDHLALFFLPAMIALVSHPEFFGWLGVKLAVAVLVGTLTVMIGTALVVDLSLFLMQRMSQPASTPLAHFGARRPTSHSQLLAVYVNHSRNRMRGASVWSSSASLENGLE